MEKKSNLDLLKEDYEKIKEKFSLPEFVELNADFSIEKLAEEETDFLVREIRKIIFDKLSYYFKFVEMLIQPANGSLLVFSIIKHFTKKEKERLSEMYRNLARKEIEIIELDLELNEQEEAEFVVRTFNDWQEIKKDLLTIIRAVKVNFQKSNEQTKTKSNYFG